MTTAATREEAAARAAIRAAAESTVRLRKLEAQVTSWLVLQRTELCAAADATTAAHTALLSSLHPPSIEFSADALANLDLGSLAQQPPRGEEGSRSASARRRSAGAQAHARMPSLSPSPLAVPKAAEAPRAAHAGALPPSAFPHIERLLLMRRGQPRSEQPQRLGSGGPNSSPPTPQPTAPPRSPADMRSDAACAPPPYAGARSPLAPSRATSAAGPSQPAWPAAPAPSPARGGEADADSEDCDEEEAMQQSREACAVLVLSAAVRARRQRQAAAEMAAAAARDRRSALRRWRGQSRAQARPLRLLLRLLPARVWPAAAAAPAAIAAISRSRRADDDDGMAAARSASHPEPQPLPLPHSARHRQPQGVATARRAAQRSSLAGLFGLRSAVRRWSKRVAEAARSAQAACDWAGAASGSDAAAWRLAHSTAMAAFERAHWQAEWGSHRMVDEWRRRRTAARAFVCLRRAVALRPVRWRAEAAGASGEEGSEPAGRATRGQSEAEAAAAAARALPAAQRLSSDDRSGGGRAHDAPAASASARGPVFASGHSDPLSELSEPSEFSGLSERGLPGAAGSSSIAAASDRSSSPLPPRGKEAGASPQPRGSRRVRPRPRDAASLPLEALPGRRSAAAASASPS